MEYILANIVMELFAAVVLLLVVIYQKTSKYSKTSANRIFFWALVANIVVLVSDSVAWALDGVPGQTAHVLLQIANFIVFFDGAMVAVALFLYVSASIGQEEYLQRRMFRVSMVVAAFYLIVFTLLQIGNQVFYIDEHNVYYEGPHYWFPVTIISLFFIAFFIITLRHCKKMAPSRTVVLLSYGLLPTIGTVINIFYKDLMFSHVAMALALIVVFVNIQVQQEKALVEKEVELTKSKIAIMLSQIQPHFLFNALTAIGNLTEGNEIAQKAIVTFSEYLRVNMDSLSENEPIPFVIEFEHTQQYLWLEQLRFKEHISVVYEIGADRFTLPVLTLQPIVENAVRHGLTPKPSGGTITIRTEEDPLHYRAIVSDDGVGFDPCNPPKDGRSHLGIQNVRARLAELSDGQLLIESAIGVGTTATIELPKRGECA